MSEHITSILDGSDLDVAHILIEFVPVSKLMAEQMTGLRSWVMGPHEQCFPHHRKFVHQQPGPLIEPRPATAVVR